MDINIPEGEGCGVIRDLPRPQFVKKWFFQEKRAWQVHKVATPLIFYTAYILRLKMRYCEFLYHLYFWSKLSSKLGISDFCKSYLIKRKCYHDSQLWAQFIPKVQVVQQLTIPHLKALVVDNDFLEGQGRGSLKRLPQPFFLKSTLFTNSGRGKPLIMPRPSSSRI